jgi:hypothetical protein
MIEKFAGVPGLVRSEFLDHHTSNSMNLVSRMIAELRSSLGMLAARCGELLNRDTSS